MAGKATSVGVWALFVEYTIADSIILSLPACHIPALSCVCPGGLCPAE